MTNEEKEFWQTSDGKQFDSYYDAQLHQNLLNELQPSHILYGLTGETESDNY